MSFRVTSHSARPASGFLSVLPVLLLSITPFSQAQPTPQVIYGQDDRIDLYQETNADRKSWAASVCAVVSTGYINYNFASNSYDLTLFNWTVGGVPPCTGEPFANQPVAADCTGVLVGPDIVLTAGHCISPSQVRNYGFVFGYVMKNATTPVSHFEANQVYFGTQVIAQRSDLLQDYAIVKLDRTVTAPGAQALPIRRKGKIGNNKPLGTIGFPAGLPLKLAFGSATKVWQNTLPDYFVANTDTYVGSSGAPAFDPVTGVVEGILAAGRDDFTMLSNCFLSNRLADGLAGEEYTRTTAFHQYIPESGNNAVLAYSTAPTELLAGQRITIEVAFRNTGTSIWSGPGGQGLRISGDTCGLYTGESQIALPPEAVIEPGDLAIFQFDLVGTTVNGNCPVILQMTTSALTPFGSSATLRLKTGESLVQPLDPLPVGWFGAVITGGTTVYVQNGLCMEAPAEGDNLLGWVTSQGYLPLVDMASLRLDVTASTNQQGTDAIPLLDLIYDNAPSNAYGGEQIVIDVAGGGNGIGRANGRSTFDLVALPVCAETLQWRGMLDNGIPGENDQSAFTPSADPLNDMRVIFRLLDIASAGVNAANDSGAVCITSLRADRSNLTSSTSLTNPEFGPPLNSQLHGVETFDQMGAGTATIDDSAATAYFQLLPSGPGSRKTLFPWDHAPDAASPFFPVSWSPNTLYRGAITLRAAETSQSPDPVDVISLAFDTATTELVTVHVCVRGTPSSLHLAGSPRPASATGGSAQPYTGFFYSHNSSALPPGQFPFARRFRFMADFANYEEIAPDGQGGDAFVVESMKVFRLPN